MDKESRYILRKVIMDFICLFVVAFPILLFYFFGKPYERGFFCDDESLRHPFKSSTITSAMLYVIGMFLPIMSFLTVEYVQFRRSNGQVARMFLGRTIHPWLWNCYKVIGIFGFGVACSHLTTDIAKYSIGRLRPHFFDVCKPDVNCSNPNMQNVYIEKFTCLGSDQHLLKEMRLSFPSGHSSYSAFTMVYLTMYLQARMTWSGSKLLRHFLQYLCLMMAWGTALSRVSDYKHHWSDVLAGSLQGTIVAIITALYVSDLFLKNHTPLPDVEADIDLSTQSGNGGTNRIA
ncbi:putative phosphatidate phosphatase [Anabrus simplex]|uniref:putative phosphatidate phosphatase n=1 Tax=Anabrus simplex TaxID=316456 RepID=UPI0035A2B0F6